MNREHIRNIMHRIVSDRGILTMGIFLLASGLVYMVVVGLNIHPSDVTVYSRYTAFGETHFYKSHWQYLLLFVLFGLVVTISHIVIMGKLHALGRRQTSLLVGWMGVTILVIALVYVFAVVGLGIAV